MLSVENLPELVTSFLWVHCPDYYTTEGHKNVQSLLMFLKLHEAFFNKNLSTGVELSADKATSPTGGVGFAVAGEVPSGGNVQRLLTQLQNERHARFQLECQLEAQKIRHLTDAIPGLKVSSPTSLVRILIHHVLTY